MDSNIELAQRFFETLRTTERLAEPELKSYQDNLLVRLVEHAVANTKFYREAIGDRLEGLDLSVPEDWRKLPTTNRSVLSSRQADLRAKSMPDNHGELKTVQSGGSTGTPIEVVLSDLESTGRVVTTYRMFDAYRMDPGLPLMMIRHPQFGSGRRDRLSFRKWCYPWLSEDVLGDRIHVDVTTPISDQFRQIQAHAPLYLNTLPSNLLRLALEAKRQKKKLSIPIIISVAEYLPVEVRRLAEETFQARVVDVLSSSEAGVIAIQCPESGQYHIQSELVLAEIIDENGEPSPPGALGELVVTPLYNYATPIIRYRSGDFVIRGRPCSCGRTLPTIEKILGRKEHMFLHPDGCQRRPSIDHVEISNFLGHDAWQLIQEMPNSCKFQYVPYEPLQTGEVGLKALLLEMLGDSFGIVIEKSGSIPLTSGGKRNYINTLMPSEFD